MGGVLQYAYKCGGYLIVNQSSSHPLTQVSDGTNLPGHEQTEQKLMKCCIFRSRNGVSLWQYHVFITLSNWMQSDTFMTVR